MVGLVVAALLTRRWVRTGLGLKALAVVITLASLAMPLSADTDTGTRVLLAAMHLVVAGAYLAALRGTRPGFAVSRETGAAAAPAASAR